MDNFLVGIFTFLSGALGILVWTSSMVVREYLLKVLDNSKILKSRWSYLPVDILEIINDKLDIFDNASMNCVCRNWWLASKNYPERQTVGDGIPWILQPTLSTRKALEIISITRKKRIILELPEFHTGDVLFSKQGWVLICLKRYCQSSNKLFHYLFLLNPLTKAIIQLPEHVISNQGQYKYVMSILPASFSIHNGRPHCVVLFDYYYHVFSLKVAQVGDEMWATHSYVCQWVRGLEIITALLIIGEDIYCCNLSGKIIVYNTKFQAWKEVVEYPQEIFMPRKYYIEYDGQLVRYQESEDPLSCGYGLSCFSNSGNVWKKFSDDFRNDKNVNGDRIMHSFMCARRAHFSGFLDQPRLLDSSEKDDDPSCPEQLNVPFTIHPKAVWVDIG